jgi:hypothetical protein
MLGLGTHPLDPRSPHDGSTLQLSRVRRFPSTAGHGKTDSAELRLTA